MKELDCIEVITEKEKYAKDGVHQGMQGWICHPEYMDGYWLVNFPQHGDADDIATIAVKETDLRQIKSMDASVNAKIHLQFTT